MVLAGICGAGAIGALWLGRVVPAAANLTPKDEPAPAGPAALMEEPAAAG